MSSIKSKALLATLVAAFISTHTIDIATAKDTVASEATVTVNVTGFALQQGAVMAALVDAKGYEGGQPIAVRKVNVTDDKIVLTFPKLPSGDYAIRMFHDVNADGDLNTNGFGMPTEPFAFSNNATGTMGPAPWSKAKFTVSGDTVQNISF